MEKLKVTLKRSPIGCTQSQISTIKGLGLRRLGSVRELENTPAVRGMVKKIIHMLEVEEVSA